MTKKLLNFNKINELYKKLSNLSFKTYYRPDFSNSHDTSTYSKSSIVVNSIQKNDQFYPICPNCYRKLPNKTFLSKNGCLWCLI